MILSKNNIELIVQYYGYMAVCLYMDNQVIAINCCCVKLGECP